MTFNLNEYVDVAQRIKGFYELFPEGRLTCDIPWLQNIGDRAFICCRARAYRTPDDTLPGDGLAWEPVPGPTQFTKDSELMNAQTAAWGRAIVALGFETKKIASADEVRNRSVGGPDGGALPDVQPSVAPVESLPAGASPTDELASDAQVTEINHLIRELAGLRDVPLHEVRDALASDGYVVEGMTAKAAKTLLGKLQRWQKNLAAAKVTA